MNETYLVLGASGGIGGACVRKLAADGASVLATSRRPPGAEVLSAGTVDWVSGDISTVVGRAAVLDRVTGGGGRLGGVVVASGISHRGPVETHTVGDWQSVLTANLVGPAQLLADLVREAMWSEPAGIVLIGSLSARRALPDRALYGASKAALEHFGRCLAVELAPRGIYVNTISVGVTDTPFLVGDEERLARYVGQRVPAGRMTEPSEVADAVRYALTSAGSLAGASIELDGASGVLG